MAIKLKPLQDRVIVKQTEAEEKTKSGIVLPDSAKEKPTKGKVITVGPGKLNEKGKLSRNAIAEGVADRVELHTANMTALPFADSSFDVVVSSLAIHNISRRADREKAIEEAVRVLRPGGRLLIADVRATRQYQQQLARSGMNEVGRRRLGWLWPAPLVTATKPEPGN